MSRPNTIISVTIRSLNGTLLEISYDRLDGAAGICLALLEIDPVAYPLHRVTIVRCDEEYDEDAGDMTRNRDGDILNVIVSDAVVARITPRRSPLMNSESRIDGEYLVQYSTDPQNESSWTPADRYVVSCYQNEFYNGGWHELINTNFDGACDTITDLAEEMVRTSQHNEGPNDDVVAATVAAWEQLTSSFRQHSEYVLEDGEDEDNYFEDE